MVGKYSATTSTSQQRSSGSRRRLDQLIGWTIAFPEKAATTTTTAADSQQLEENRPQEEDRSMNPPVIIKVNTTEAAATTTAASTASTTTATTTFGALSSLCWSSTSCNDDADEQNMDKKKSDHHINAETGGRTTTTTTTSTTTNTTTTNDGSAATGTHTTGTTATSGITNDSTISTMVTATEMVTTGGTVNHSNSKYPAAYRRHKVAQQQKQHRKQYQHQHRRGRSTTPVHQKQIRESSIGAQRPPLYPPPTGSSSSSSSSTASTQSLHPQPSAVKPSTTPPPSTTTTTKDQQRGDSSSPPTTTTPRNSSNDGSSDTCSTSTIGGETNIEIIMGKEKETNGIMDSCMDPTTSQKNKRLHHTVIVTRGDYFEVVSIDEASHANSLVVGSTGNNNASGSCRPNHRSSDKGHQRHGNVKNSKLRNTSTTKPTTKTTANKSQDSSCTSSSYTCTSSSSSSSDDPISYVESCSFSVNNDVAVVSTGSVVEDHEPLEINSIIIIDNKEDDRRPGQLDQHQQQQGEEDEESPPLPPWSPDGSRTSATSNATLVLIGETMIGSPSPREPATKLFCFEEQEDGNEEKSKHSSATTTAIHSSTDPPGSKADVVEEKHLLSPRASVPFVVEAHSSSTKLDTIQRNVHEDNTTAIGTTNATVMSTPPPPMSTLLSPPRQIVSSSSSIAAKTVPGFRTVPSRIPAHVQCLYHYYTPPPASDAAAAHNEIIDLTVPTTYLSTVLAPESLPSTNNQHNAILTASNGNSTKNVSFRYPIHVIIPFQQEKYGENRHIGSIDSTAVVYRVGDWVDIIDGLHKDRTGHVVKVAARGGLVQVTLLMGWSHQSLYLSPSMLRLREI